MTTVSELTIELRHATGPDRRLDALIARILGYERTEVLDGANGRKVLWFHPKRGGAVRIPRYTGNIDAAQQLTQTIVPGCSAGFTWGIAYATAKINDGPPVVASTPALALCIAALSAKYMQEK